VNIFALRAKGRLALSLAFVIFVMTWLSATTAFAKTENQQPTNQNAAGSTFGALSRALSDHQDARVTLLQRELASKGVSPGPIDGFYGPQTEYAVANYQRAHSLTVDGIAGVQTFTALRHGGAKQTQELQTGLSQLGFNSGAADGLYGPKTTEAVTAFQQQNRLTVDGFAGPQTLGELTQLKSRQSPPAAPQASNPGVQIPQAPAPQPKPLIGHTKSASPNPWMVVGAAAFAIAVFALARYTWLRQRRYKALARRYVDLAKARDWTLNWEKRFGLDKEGSETTVPLINPKKKQGPEQSPGPTSQPAEGEEQ
jgi:peptidoglycan hydrolase-like protein with peptidoglycan-binding domain